MFTLIAILNIAASLYDINKIGEKNGRIYLGKSIKQIILNVFRGSYDFFFDEKLRNSLFHKEE